MNIDQVVSKTGMSTRPEYYSGYGPNEADLSSLRLREIRDQIRTHYGEDASIAFSEMVWRLPTLAPTVFLRALYALEANNWILQGEPSPSTVALEPRGKTVEEMGAVLVGTITALQSRDRRRRERNDRDLTIKIKNEYFYGIPGRWVNPWLDQGKYGRG